MLKVFPLAEILTVPNVNGQTLSDRPLRPLQRLQDVSKTLRLRVIAVAFEPQRKNLSRCERFF
jgi:hypothetical protein